MNFSSFGWNGEKSKIKKWILTPILNNRKSIYFRVWAVWYVGWELSISSARFGNKDKWQSDGLWFRWQTDTIAKGAHPQKTLEFFWFNFSDTFDQILYHCLVFFCVIDYQHIFDCRFFLFRFIKCLYMTKTFFIGKAQLIPFRKVDTRKYITTYWFKEKGSFLFQ